MQTIVEMLRNTVREYPDRVAVVCGGERYTYQEVDRRVGQWADGFASAGVRPRDWVMELIPNSAELVFSHLALIRLGAIAVPLNVMYRMHEIEYVAHATRAVAIIGDAEILRPLTQNFAARLPAVKQLAIRGGRIPGALDFDESLGRPTVRAEPWSPRLDDIASVIFTSGTTGRPKGATQTHRSILSAVQGCSVQNKFCSSDVFLCALPMFNNFGLNVLMMSCFSVGGTLVIVDRFDAQKVLETIRSEKATYFAGTPTMFVYLLHSYDPAKHDVTSLRVTNSGGAHCAHAVIENVEQVFGVVHLDGYGQTEGCGFTTLNPIVGVRKPNSVGLPLSNTWIKIVDDDGNELPAGQVGEIVEKGDVFSVHMYWEAPEVNAQAYRDGWFHSGDLGYVDEHGYLYVVDRKQDLIITGGYNIYPTEVEDVLLGHPKVAMAALIGIPDPEKGEIAKAYVVLKPGETAEADEIIAYVREKMAKFKAPRIVEFVPSLPLGPTGKVVKRELKRQREIGGPQASR
jgi:acyl-CoA synthetase (AMP-forming)/AMP-acid ligase II